MHTRSKTITAGSDSKIRDTRARFDSPAIHGWSCLTHPTLGTGAHPLKRSPNRVPLVVRSKRFLDTDTQLTQRERDVLALLARGCSYGQISERLGVSLNTIATHIKNIYRKLGVHSARRAVWRALELQLLGDTDAHLPVSSEHQPGAEHGPSCVRQ